MSQEDQQNKRHEQTHSLLQGPLKHIKAAALAAALVPLASVAAAPAEAQEGLCQSAGICGFVWYDANSNGVQDPGEDPIPNWPVTITSASGSITVPTDVNGIYYVVVPDGDYTISVLIPNDKQPSMTGVGTDPNLDSDGVPNGGNSVAPTFTYTEGEVKTDFGFSDTPGGNPGTGTPGYWMNHPEAWPVESITIGGTPYTKAQAIAILQAPGNKDKTYTMFSSLVPAILNVEIGNSNCVVEEIAAAQAWMAAHPIGSEVRASSYDWKIGEPTHRTLDNYNNGMLCAPHRE